MDCFAWAKTCIPSIKTMTSLPGDASVRRYYRINTPPNTPSCLLMDSSDDRAAFERFVTLDQTLSNILRVPHIFHVNPTAAWAILEDFGMQRLDDVLTPSNVHSLYLSAIQNLLQLQPLTHLSLRNFYHDMFELDWNGFCYWFLEKHCQLHLANDDKQLLSRASSQLQALCHEQPTVVIHRDYHCRNIMLLEDNILGILDFQDAALGPICYDLVSLLRDCYISWPETTVMTSAHTYWELATQQQLLTCSWETFQRWFDGVALQRHVKALGTFAKKALHDDNPSYLEAVPRVLNYIRQETTTHSEWHYFHVWLLNIGAFT